MSLTNNKTIAMALSAIYLCVVLIFAQHFSALYIIMLLLLCSWQLALVHQAKAKPSNRLLNVVAAVSLVILYFTIGISNTVDLFVAMLLLASAFKLLQAQQKKQFQNIIILSFFSLCAVYLYQQSIVITLLVSSLYVANFAVLALIGAENQLKSAFKQSTKLLLLALPVAVFMLIFFPRLPAFWQLPGPKTAQTGLNENIDPFNIAKLSESDELVFRAEFNGELAPEPLYWRAILHDNYTGKGWRSTAMATLGGSAAVNLSTPPEFNYTIILEPNNHNWLYGLNYARSQTKSVLNNAHGMLAKRSGQNQKLQYQVTSYSLSSEQLTAPQQRYYSELKATNNPATLALAQKLKQNAPTDSALFSAVLNYFMQQQFSYTLNPQPSQSDDAIDDFMFNSKQGFCGHYASAAAFIFRSAGIPARVVSGYLGGEYNHNNNTYSVRQYDAHAWVEVYLVDKGWQIFDATSVVAPQRLQGSLSQNKDLTEQLQLGLDFAIFSFSENSVITWLRLELESLDYQWSSLMLGFDQEKQLRLLNNLFGSHYIWLVPLISVFILLLCVFSYFLYLYKTQKPANNAAMVREYQIVLNWAEKQSIEAPKHFSPLQKLHYFASQRPTKAEYLSEFSVLFEQVRYQQQSYSKQRKNQAINLINLIKTTK